MRSKRYAEITPDCVRIYTRKLRGWDVASFAQPIENGPVLNASAVILANMPQVAIRVSDMPASEKLALGANVTVEEIVQFQKAKIKKRMNQAADRWDMVATMYPIGNKMNENTHIFDGAEFANNGVSRFYMTAFSFDVADEITNVGVSVFGNASRLKRMDTVEHLMFQHFCKKGTDAFWVVFPQGDGLRILLLTDGLPKAAWHVSNEPRFREGEVLRCLHGSKNLHLLKPVEKKPALTLIAEGRMYIPPPPKPKEVHEETALNRAVVLNSDMDLEWLYALLAEHGVEVEKREYRLEDYLP